MHRRSANKVRPGLQFPHSPPISSISSVALVRSTTNPGGFALPSKRATLGHAAPQQPRPANPRRDAPVRPLAVGALPERQVYAPGADGDNTLDHPLGGNASSDRLRARARCLKCGKRAADLSASRSAEQRHRFRVSRASGTPRRDKLTRPPARCMGIYQVSHC